MFVNLATGSQTPAALDHKHKHDQAAAARPGSHRHQAQAPGSSCATSAAGSHRHQARGPRTRQRSAATRHADQLGRQRITAAAAVNQAANNCTRCSNQAANNCKPGSAAHGPGSHRQQLQGANQAAAARDTCTRFHASRSRHHAAGLAGGHAGQVSRPKPASPWAAGAIPGIKKPGARPGSVRVKVARSGRQASSCGQVGQHQVGRAQGVGLIVGEILGDQVATGAGGAHAVFGLVGGPGDADQASVGQVHQLHQAQAVGAHAAHLVAASAARIAASSCSG